MSGKSGVLLLHEHRLQDYRGVNHGFTLVSLDPYAPAQEGGDRLMPPTQSNDVRLHVGLTCWQEHCSRVEMRLGELSDLLGSTRFDLVAYEAAILVSVREYWRMVYEEVTRRYGETTYFTDLEDVDIVPYTRLSALMTSMRAICMRECFPQIRFSTPDFPRQVSQLSSWDRERWIDNFDRTWGFLQQVRTFLRYRMGKHLRHFGRGGVSGAAAVVVAQEHKKGQLLSQLEGSVKFTETALMDIYPTRTSTACSGAGPDFDPVHAYLVARLETLEQDAELTQRFVQGSWEVLLTDQEHDPAMRQIIQAVFDHTQKRVITTPEGAQSLTGSEVVGLTRQVYVHDSRIIRCATSAGEAQRMTALFGTEVIRSGYLAAIPVARGFAAHLQHSLVAKLVGGATTPERPLVLLNLDNEPDLGMTRSGVPCMPEKLSSLIRLMDYLANNDTRFIITCKSPDGIGAVRDLCRGRSAGVFAHVPWRVLMSVSSVMIQRDSSLGPEAVAAGYPTIVWDDLGLPLASREWLEGNSPWVQLCTDESSLLAALSKIRMGVAPKEHPQPWDLITPNRQVAEWIVKDRAQRGAGLSH